jgi:hypothetical protein
MFVFGIGLSTAECLLGGVGSILAVYLCLADIGLASADYPGCLEMRDVVRQPRVWS